MFRFIYRAELDHGLVEHELDHVFLGRYDGDVTPNLDEVEAVRWVAPADLSAEIAAAPEAFAPWFRIIVDEMTARALI